MDGDAHPRSQGGLLRLAMRVHSAARHRELHTVFQTSTMSALLAGVYDGDVSIAELLGHGDFGLGTFNHLDGELVIVDGVCHHLRADGTATRASASDLTPFAVVTWFRPQLSLTIDAPMSYAELGELVTAKVDNANVIHAIKVTGRFTRVRTRTVARQHQPYPPLTEATKGQTEAVFTDVSGTLVGYLTPDYEQGLSVAGYHLHFISADERHGGHCLDFTLDTGTVGLDTEHDVHLSLPRSEEFRSAALSSESVDAQVRQAEGSQSASE
jgi:acetolactate decarboxylase